MIEGIELAGVDSAHKFEWVPGEAGGISGVASLKSLSVKSIQPEVAGLFSGSAGLTTETIKATWVGRSRLPAIDVNKPRIHLMADASDASTKRKIFIKELGAESVHLDENLKATVTGGFASGIEYADDVVHVRVDELALPGDVTADAGHGTIPEIKLTKGRINLDLEKIAAASAFTPATPSHTWISEAQLGAIADSLDGFASTNVAVRYDGTPLIDDRVTAEVHRGRINYEKLIASALPSYLRPDDLPVRFWVDGSRLNFGKPKGVCSTASTARSTRASRWSSCTGRSPAEIADAAANHELRVFRLPEVEIDVGSGSGSSSSTPSKWGVTLYDIAAKLSTLNPSPLPLMFVNYGAGWLVGNIKFSKNALSDFTLAGDLSVLGTGGGVLSLKLEKLGIDEVHLGIRTAAGTGVTANTGLIEVNKLSSAGIYFKGLTPTELFGQIDELARPQRDLGDHEPAGEIEDAQRPLGPSRVLSRAPAPDGGV